MQLSIGISVLITFFAVAVVCKNNLNVEVLQAKGLGVAKPLESSINPQKNTRSISHGPSPDPNDPQTSLHAFLIRKAEDVRQVVRHGYTKTHLPCLDPFKIDSFRVLMQENEGFVNMTLKKTTIHGLGDFLVKDVASNIEAGQASVLISYPEIRISGVYKMKGFLNPPFSRQMVNDEGQFTALVSRAGATWSTYLSPLNPEEVRVTQTDVTAFFDDIEHSFESFNKKATPTEVSELRDTVASALVEKIQRKVEDALINAFGVSLSKSSWTPPARHNYDTSMTMSSSSSASKYNSYHQQDTSLVRRKRQVPCNNGQELEEYVNTLLSFASRIVRIMEPIGFPNITAYIDNQLIVFLYNGRARGVSTISSRKEPYVFCPNDTITLGMVVGFKDLTIEANYRVMQDYQMLLFNGEAEIRVTEPVTFVQLTQVTYPDDTKQTLDRLKIWSIGKIQVLLKGLGNLTKAISMILTNTINQDPGQFVGMLEEQLADMMRQQLANISVPLFSLI